MALMALPSTVSEAVRAARFLWCWFEEGAVVFDRWTGDTHALDCDHAKRLLAWEQDRPDGVTGGSGATTGPEFEQLRALGLV